MYILNLGVSNHIWACIPKRIYLLITSLYVNTIIYLRLNNLFIAILRFPMNDKYEQILNKTSTHKGLKYDYISEREASRVNSCSSCVYPANTKHLYNIYTTSAQRLRR